MNAPEVVSYMPREAGPLPFCPGCGHERLLKELDRALVRLQVDPSKTVIVTDIGCIGLSDRYFSTSGFHGLHGRSLTYATGLKLARPELTVIALIGDGGCGIGGAHLLNAARRNLDLTLIIANNFNYGMTGGQHSVTTPIGGVTATTAGGNLEGPMDICATLAGAGATWVYRGMTHDADLAERIAQGVRHPGFSVLDVWELCTAYYTPRNDMNKRELINLVQTTGMATGLLVERERPEFGAACRANGAAKAKAPRSIVMERAFAHALDRQVGIVIAGSAGQKVKSAATILGRAGILCGLDATQKDDYPITIMTGHSLSEINFSPERIEYTAIDSPDWFAVVSIDGLKKTRKWIGRLPETCTLLIDETLEAPPTAARVLALPLLKAAKEVGRFSSSVIAMAAILARSRIFPLAAFEEAISRYQSAGVAEMNLKAVRKGAELVA
ncbi:MAG: 2-oxoacid:acceptor oxidoreductase family protein [Burkholderiaceae bacterium]|nr:2-oxoacid:acceptor oxidoreductase family protein [Burkholderiaceae bacterium]